MTNHPRDVAPSAQDMRALTDCLQRWEANLCRSVSIGGLIARCPVAHKWKAPYRALVVREALLWRMTDLGKQMVVLNKDAHILGARILLRSGIETLGVLIYLNQKTNALVRGETTYGEFDECTGKLLLGSRNETTSVQSVNVLTVLERADRKYNGIRDLHERLSESAHPNYDGVLAGYSRFDPENHETTFCNRWVENFGREQVPAAEYVFTVFEHEYNVEFIERIQRLEEWLRINDARLEAEQYAHRTSVPHDKTDREQQ